jgi:sec-independent protein translocase protein TatA
MGMIGWPHILLLLAVLLLLFGAARLPILARSLGQSARLFKGEVDAMRSESAAAVEEGAPQEGPPHDRPSGSAGHDHAR